MRTCLVLAVPVLALAACAQPYVEPRLGFIPKSVTLVDGPGPDESHQWIDPDASASEYGKIEIDQVRPVTTGQYEVSDEDIKQVCALFEGRLRKEFIGWQGTGSKTLVIHAAVTALRANDPARNVRSTGTENRADRGYAACEIYCTDGSGGDVVAAYMETSHLGRRGTKRIGELGTVEGVVNDWTLALKDLFKKAKPVD